MMSIFSDFLEDIMEVFVDDFSIYGSNFESFFSELTDISRKLCQGRSSTEL